MSDGDSEAFKKFFQTAAEGGWRLLQHYMCGPTPGGFRGANQRGNGMGGIHCARNSHRVIPLHAFHGTSMQSGKGPWKTTPDMEVDAEDDEDHYKTGRIKKCHNSSKPVSPAQQSTEQAKSNLKREAEDAKKNNARSPSKKRKMMSIV